MYAIFNLKKFEIALEKATTEKNIELTRVISEFRLSIISERISEENAQVVKDLDKIDALKNLEIAFPFMLESKINSIEVYHNGIPADYSCLHPNEEPTVKRIMDALKGLSADIKLKKPRMTTGVALGLEGVDFSIKFENYPE